MPSIAKVNAGERAKYNWSSKGHVRRNKNSRRTNLFESAHQQIVESESYPCRRFIQKNVDRKYDLRLKAACKILNPYPTQRRFLDS